MLILNWTFFCGRIKLKGLSVYAAVVTMAVLFSMQLFNNNLDYDISKSLPLIVEEDVIKEEVLYQNVMDQSFDLDRIIEDYVKRIVKISKRKVSEEQAFIILQTASEVANLYKIPLNIILGMIAQESNFLSTAESFLGPEYGRGLMQVSDIGLKDFNLKTGSNISTLELYNPKVNLIVGCWIYNNNVNYGVEEIHSHLIIAYNCGHRVYKNEKEYLLNAKRSNGNNYKHLNKVLGYIEEFSRIEN